MSENLNKKYVSSFACYIQQEKALITATSENAHIVKIFILCSIKTKRLQCPYKKNTHDLILLNQIIG